MLFETIFKDDKDLAKYRHLADQMLKELHDDFKVKLDIVITELRHFVLKQVEIRADEIKLYQKCTDDVKGEVDKECISRIRAFIKYKKHVRHRAETIVTSSNRMCGDYKMQSQLKSNKALPIYEIVSVNYQII